MFKLKTRYPDRKEVPSSSFVIEVTPTELIKRLVEAGQTFNQATVLTRASKNFGTNVVIGAKIYKAVE